MLRRLGERGVAVVEMAIVVPLLVLLAFGTVETSYLIMQQNSVRAAAREGARIAATNDLPTGTIEDMLRPGLPEGANVNVLSICSPVGVDPAGSRGAVGAIEITGEHQPLIGFMFAGARLSARLQFKVEVTTTPDWWTGAPSC